MEELSARLGALGVNCAHGLNSLVLKKSYVRSGVYSLRCGLCTDGFEVTLLDKAGHPIEGVLPFFDIHSSGSTKKLSCVECVFRYISAICDYRQRELLGAITERTYKCSRCLPLPVPLPVPLPLPLPVPRPRPVPLPRPRHLPLPLPFPLPVPLPLPLPVPESSRLSMFIQIVVIGIVAGSLYSKFMKK